MINYNRKNNRITIFSVNGIYFEELRDNERIQVITAIAKKEGISYELALSEIN